MSTKLRDLLKGGPLWERYGRVPNEYQYASLEPDEIRTLVLHPGNGDEELNGTIEQHKLGAQDKPYDALSYVWGSPKRNRQLHVGDQQVRITSNAEALLRHLRNFKIAQRIWIDGICINQGDLAERGHQITLMNSIFSQAATVLIWVGDSDAHTESVFSFFRDLAGRHEASAESESKAETGATGETARADVPSLTEHEDDGFSRVRAFADRSWFHRAWTFQEACLSAESYLLCGQYRLPFRTVTSAGIYLSTHGMASVFGTTSDTIISLAHFSLANPNHQTPYLSVVLPLTRTLQATEPRDKIFSFLGMIDRKGLPHIAVSYSTSVSEVYSVTAKAMIAQEGGLSVLSGILGRRHQDPTLPSWVPDWRLPRRTAYLHGYDWPTRTNIYHINAGSPFENSVAPDLGSDPAVLQLRGAHIDTITHVYKPDALLKHLARFPGPGKKSPPKLTLDAWQDELESTINKILRSISRWCTYFQTKEGMSEALMRTLTADRGGVGGDRMGVWVTDDVLIGMSMFAPVCHWWSGALDEGEAHQETDKELAMKRLVTAMWTFLTGRNILLTELGLIGIVGTDAKVGDEVWDLVGGEVAFVLRNSNRRAQTMERKKRVLVGEAYVHGIMRGGLWEAEISKNPSLDKIYPEPKIAVGKDLVFEDLELV